MFVARNNSEKKLLGEEEKEKRLFLKDAKILQGIKSEHIVKFKTACMEPCAMMLEHLICFSTSLPSAAQKLLAVWTNFVHNVFNNFFKTELVSSILRTVVVKRLYFPMRFV